VALPSSTARSSYVPPKGEPDEILAAIKEAINDNSRLAELPEEEVDRQFALEGRLQGEPSLQLVAEALDAIEAEEGNLT
jgi:hypothetical protein